MSGVTTAMCEAERSPLREGATVYLTLTPRAKATEAALAEPAALTHRCFDDFLPPEEAGAAIAAAYEAEGCRCVASSRVGLTLAVPAPLAGPLFGRPVRVRRNRLIREFERFDFHADGPLTPRLASGLIARAVPAGGSFELDISPHPPEVGYHHLDLPHDIAEIGAVGDLHRQGVTGLGVPVAMIDTGLYSHPYYACRGIAPRRIAAVPEFDAATDERGHGTAMSAVLTAIAPGITLSMVKMADEGFAFPVASLQHASRLGVRIVNCSWGLIGDDPQAHLELANLHALGITVTLASGNGSDDRRSAMFQSLAPPWAISVGGVYIGADATRTPSGIASHFASRIFPGRDVPDLSGPCGDPPNGYLIVFPTQPGCQFDRRNARGDGTRPDDGWLVSSGTSAASAYVAGMAALLLQRRPELDPAAVKAALLAAAEPVAGGGTGAGIVTGRGLFPLPQREQGGQ